VICLDFSQVLRFCVKIHEFLAVDITADSWATIVVICSPESCLLTDCLTDDVTLTMFDTTGLSDCT